MAGLYIHIPFCVKKCLYCDFVSVPTERGGVAEYAEALIDELRMLGERFGKNEISTVFIGGGTPSILPKGCVSKIMDALFGSFFVAPSAEITIEANPGTLTKEKLSEYARSGINRISLGLQSANDAILAGIGRIHTFGEFTESFRAAREAGFSNINVDIMYGLPGQSQEAYLQTIEAVCGEGAEHISAYSLILEENTPLFEMVKAKRQELPSEDEEYAMYKSGAEALAKAGYTRYEVSNYCRQGFECRHNLNYWNNGEYIGAGVAAHSAFNDRGWRRWYNTSDIEAYKHSVSRGELPIEQSEAIPREEEMFETIMTGLRKTEGVSSAEFKKRFGAELSKVYAKAIARLTGLGWLAADSAGVRLTDAGMDMQNRALMEFLDERG